MKTSKTTTLRTRLLPLALAFVMVGATMAINIDSVEAHPCAPPHPCAHQLPPTGGVGEFTIGPRQEMQTLEFKLENFGADLVDSVLFEIPWLDQKGRKRIDFVKPYSGAFNWDVEVDNTKGPNVYNRMWVNATAPEFYQISSAATADTRMVFTIALRPVGNPSGIIDASGATLPCVPLYYTPHFVSGGATNRHSVPLCIDKKEPEILPGGAVTLDRDSDGHLDALLVTFDERMDESTLQKSQFQVRGYDILNINWTRPFPTNPELVKWIPYPFDIYLPGFENEVPWYGICPSESPQASKTNDVYGCSQLLIDLKEQSFYDTGARPELRLGSGPLADLAGNKVDRSSPETIDGAPPLLMGAVAANTNKDFDDYEVIRLEFSEKIQYSDRTQGSGWFWHPGLQCKQEASSQSPCGDSKYPWPTGPDTSRMSAVQPRLTANAFAYSDAPGGAVHEATSPNQGKVPDVASILHPPPYRDDQDFQFVDLVMATKLTAADTPLNGPDTVSCGILPEHIRDWGNGGEYYNRPFGGDSTSTMMQNTTKAPALDPHKLGSRDNGHGLMCNPKPVPVQTIQMVRAMTDIWSDRAEVWFNVPVTGFDPQEPETEFPLRLGSLDIVPTNGGGPKGIVEIIHTPCTNHATIVFADAQKEKVLPTDVDDTPSHVRSVPDRIRTCGTGIDEDNEIFDLPQVLGEMEVPLQDKTKPTVKYAKTIDQDKNGIVDGFFIKWSEPVHDASFCERSINCPKSSGAVKIEDPTGNRQDEMKDYGPFTFDTDLMVDDDEIIIKWREGYTDAAGQFHQRGPQHPMAIHTGVVPHLRLEEDLLTDLVRPGPNQMPDLTSDKAIFEYDAAPPVVWIAETVDNEVNVEVSDPECLFGGPFRCDPNPDGLINGYRITFSERVADLATFDPDDWHVEDYTVTGMELENTDGDGWYDEVSFLTVAERPETFGDTGDTPELTYKRTADSAFGGFADMRGNRLLDFGAIAVEEIDDARPAVFKVEGFENNNNITIHFSEPVDDGAGAPVVRSDFTFENLNGRNGQVSGFAISDRSEPGQVDPAEIKHTLGSRIAVAPLNGQLTASDIGSDMIRPKIGAIREIAPNVVDKKYIVNVQKGLNFAPDESAPCAVRDLDIDLKTANSLRLSWIAPADDCTPSGADKGGTVSGYIIKLNATKFSQFNETSSSLPADVVLEFDPASYAIPGGTQTVDIIGLDTNTRYYAAVRAFDDAGNYGPATDPSGQLISTFDQTLIDTTAPTGTLKISSTTHKQGVPTTKLAASFTWEGLEDKESAILYHYRLNNDPDYQVVAGDAKVAGQQLTLDIPGDGDWYVHIRGFSGGGPAPGTGHFHLKIGAVVLDPEDLAVCDQEINSNLRVIHKGGRNQLNWTLPECADDLGDLVSLYIWRIDQGNEFFLPLDVVDGTYDDLRRGNYTDKTGSQTKNSKYLLQAEYAAGADASAQGQRAADPTLDDEPSAVKPINKDPGTVPAWIWILLGVAMALIIAGLVIFFVLRSKDRVSDAATAAGYQWEELGGGPSGVDQASGLPIHDIQCPSCSTRFQAVGNTPLDVACPNCRVSGTLD